MISVANRISCDEEASWLELKTFSKVDEASLDGDREPFAGVIIFDGLEPCSIVEGIYSSEVDKSGTDDIAS